jgi:hypothetical protein
MTRTQRDRALAFRALHLPGVVDPETVKLLVDGVDGPPNG